MSVILKEIKGGIATISLNRPEVYNALNGEGYRLLADTITEVSKNAETRVIVLRGIGKSFCSGSDIREFVRKNVHQLRTHYRKVADVLQAMWHAKQLVIAAVHGYVLGGGSGITAGADLAIAAEGSVFGLPEVELGIFPMTIMPAICRNLGAKKATELLFLGEKISAEEAEKIGLINKVVPLGEFDATVEQWANKIANANPTAIKLGKEAYRVSAGMNYFDSIDYLHNMMAISAADEVAQEWIQAFIDRKRR